MSDTYQGAVWMFGIRVKEKSSRKKHPIYIRVFMNTIANVPNICISFHIARFEMYMPFKGGNL